MRQASLVALHSLQHFPRHCISFLIKCTLLWDKYYYYYHGISFGYIKVFDKPQLAKIFLCVEIV